MAINRTFITQRKSLWLLQRVEEPSQMAIMGQEMWVQISACCLYKSLWEEAMSITFLQGDSRARFLTQHGHPLPSLRLPVCLVKVFLTECPQGEDAEWAQGRNPYFLDLAAEARRQLSEQLQLRPLHLPWHTMWSPSERILPVEPQLF